MLHQSWSQGCIIANVTLVHTAHMPFPQLDQPDLLISCHHGTFSLLSETDNSQPKFSDMPEIPSNVSQPGAVDQAMISPRFYKQHLAKRKIQNDSKMSRAA